MPGGTVLVKDLRIISGGQTGADRAALDFAVANGIPHGGWCPAGRKAEDGPVPPRYRLHETPSAEYAQRTEWNVRDSDGTVVFSLAAELKGGSKQTAEFARRYGRPLLRLSAASARNQASTLLGQFVQENGISVLNVAGPRASEEPGIGDFVMAALTEAFGARSDPQPAPDS